MMEDRRHERTRSRIERLDRALQPVEWARCQRGRRPLQGQSIRQVVARLMTDKNYAAVQQQETLREVWRRTVGPQLASFSLPGRIRGGTLEVVVEDSGTAQEIALRQGEIVSTLAQELAGVKIQRIKCRMGQVR